MPQKPGKQQSVVVVFFLTRSLELELHFDEVLHTYLAGFVDDELVVVERVSSGVFNTCADAFPHGHHASVRPVGARHREHAQCQNWEQRF